VEAAPAEAHQVGGPSHLVGQAVEVDVTPLELVQDRLELGHGVGVPERIGAGGVGVGHGRGPLLGSFGAGGAGGGGAGAGGEGATVTRLRTEPSASWVTSSVPGARSAEVRTSVPSSSRVMDQPRSRARRGSSA